MEYTIYISFLLKERKQELEEDKKTHPRPKTMAEKYHDLKTKGSITAGDVATIVRLLF